MKYFLLSIALLTSIFASAQMDNQKLEELLSKHADSVVGISGRWQVTYKELPMMVITDETNNRMRIIAPIVDVDQLSKDVLLDCLAANFHSALDVKYALSNDIIWSVYIHPLSPLTEMEVESAVSQVYYAAATFGNTYTSTPLVFGGANGEPQEPEIKLNKM